MKKFLVIPLMFLYLLSVSGVVCYAHYCGADLVSVNVYSETDGCDDGGCGDESEEPDGCCEDKVVTAKVIQDQNSLDAFKLKISAYTEAILPVTYYHDNRLVHAVHYITKIHQANAPPGTWQSLPLYKLHSSFTYYG
jgi:hypothetical protein